MFIEYYSFHKSYLLLITYALYHVLVTEYVYFYIFKMLASSKSFLSLHIVLFEFLSVIYGIGPLYAQRYS